MRPADDVGATGRRSAPARRRARPRRRSGRRGTARRRSTVANLLRELAVGQVQRALADEAGGRGVPERGRAAVAEHDLVAVGERRTARRGPARTRPTTSLTGFCRCEVPITRRRRRRGMPSCSGRTFEGPQPKRPSAGLRSAGHLVASSGLASAAIEFQRCCAQAYGGYPIAPRWFSPPRRRQSRQSSESTGCSELRVDPVHLRAQLACPRARSGVAACSSRMRWKFSWPALFSAIHSRAKSPDWISPRISFIAARVSSVITRLPRVRSPYSAVLEIE